jgi:hypothetical protein
LRNNNTGKERISLSLLKENLVTRHWFRLQTGALGVALDDWMICLAFDSPQPQPLWHGNGTTRAQRLSLKFC